MNVDDRTLRSTTSSSGDDDEARDSLVGARAGARPAILLLAALSLACSRSDPEPKPQTAEAAAEQLCVLANEVIADTSITADAKLSRWVHRAAEEVHQPAVRAVVEEMTKSGGTHVEEPLFLAMQDALGKPWTCPAARELLP